MAPSPPAPSAPRPRAWRDGSGPTRRRSPRSRRANRARRGGSVRGTPPGPLDRRRYAAAAPRWLAPRWRDPGRSEPCRRRRARCRRANAPPCARSTTRAPGTASADASPRGPRRTVPRRGGSPNVPVGDVARFAATGVASELPTAGGDRLMSDVSSNIERIERWSRPTTIATTTPCAHRRARLRRPYGRFRDDAAGDRGRDHGERGLSQRVPGRNTEILEAFGDGDRVVSHVRMTGTNDGGLPWAGMPANGAKVDMTGSRSRASGTTGRSRRPGLRWIWPR